MRSWRKVFGSEFKDDFKPFTTENKVKLPNRAEFTGDKFPSKTGDPAKVELNAWHKDQSTFNSFRNKEKKDDYTSLINVPEGRQEEVEDVVSKRNKWFVRFADIFQEQVTDGSEPTEEVPENVVGEGVRSSFKRKAYNRRKEKSFIDPGPGKYRFNFIITGGEMESGKKEGSTLVDASSLKEAVNKFRQGYPYTSYEDEDKEVVGTGKHFEKMGYCDIEVRFNGKLVDGIELNNGDGRFGVEGGNGLKDFDFYSNSNYDEETFSSKKVSWRKVLAIGEPDINLKRKPDGTMELNVTHPTPEAEDEEQTQLQQEDQQFNQAQNTPTKTAPTQTQQQIPAPTQTASMKKKAYEEDLFEPYMQRTYVTDDGEYEVYFADSYIELIRNNRVVNEFDYPQDMKSAPVHGEPPESEDQEGIYLNTMDNYLEFHKNGKVVTTLHFNNMKEAPDDSMSFESSLNKKASMYDSAAEVRDRVVEITDPDMVEDIPEYDLRKMIEDPKRYELSPGEIANLKLVLKRNYGGPRKSSLSKKASVDDKVHEWIIKKEGAYTLLGRECKDNAGIFILNFPKGVLAKAASLANKLDYAVDKEIVPKNGHQWRELINESLWISRFDDIVKGKK